MADEEEEGGIGQNDITFNESKDGFNVPEPTPFYPAIRLAFYDESTHDGGTFPN